MTNNIFVSVVIIGRNEGERLLRCIQSVKNISYSREQYEIIYVDSNSSDNSLIIAEELCVDKALLLVSDNPCAAAGRNRGLKEAQGDLVLFLDGDTILEPEFLNKAIPYFKNKEIAIVYGDRSEIHQEQFYINLCNKDWNRTYGFTETSGGDILIRKDVINEIGGYYEIIAGEDPELSNRVINEGYQILHIEEKMIDHDLGITKFPMYWKHAVRSGFAFQIVADLTKNREITLWRTESRKIMVQGLVLLFIPLVSVITFLAFQRYFFSIFNFFFLNIIVISRFLIKNWEKYDSLKMKFAYSILHCYLLKIPMLFGQLKYVFGRKHNLIEYK